MPHYNKGQLYEVKIRDLLYKRGILPDELHGNDAGFMHRGKPYYTEIKVKKAPDFGQKGMIWSKELGWQWRENDIVSEMFDSIGARNRIDPNFEPRRYSITQEKITIADKRYDQEQIKMSGLQLDDINFLYEFYARKNCYYIQIEELGFYHLKTDIANLGVPQFSPKLTLRLRAKTHHSKPIYRYSFFVVINSNLNKFPKSDYDLEEKVGQFPQLI